MRIETKEGCSKYNLLQVEERPRESIGKQNGIHVARFLPAWFGLVYERRKRLLGLEAILELSQHQFTITREQLTAQAKDNYVVEDHHREQKRTGQLV